ncbi:MAG: DegV family protein [Clostridiales bacterium]|nr:DegV family protein [Clostridiales bacterium]
MNYRIFTDATADMNEEMLAGLPKVEIVPMQVELDGQNYTYGPGGDLTVEQFYTQLKEGKFASTSQINPAVYHTAFEPALRAGFDILYLCFTSGMSGTIHTAEMSIAELREQYPDRKILCIDTLCASAGEGFLVREAARMQAAGLDLEELAAWVTEHRLQVCHWFTVDTFDHLRHGGRVSAAAAVLGTMLQVKPLLHVDEEGALQVVEKPRGRSRAVQAKLSRMAQGWMPELGKLVVIGHGACPEEGEKLKTAVLERFPDAEIQIVNIGPVIGAHTGPGMLALLYWGGSR